MKISTEIYCNAKIFHCSVFQQWHVAGVYWWTIRFLSTRSEKCLECYLKLEIIINTQIFSKGSTCNPFIWFNLNNKMLLLLFYSLSLPCNFFATSTIMFLVLLCCFLSSQGLLSEMPAACDQLTEAGNNLLIATHQIKQEPFSHKIRYDLVDSARNILEGTMKVSTNLRWLIYDSLFNVILSTTVN